MLRRANRLFAWGENHDQLLAFQLRGSLDGTDILHPLSEIAHDLEALVHISDFTASEHDGDLGFIAVFQELPDIAKLILKIMHIGLRAKLHFLHLDDRLLFTSLMFFLLFLVFKLTVIANLANGRLSVRRDLHEVQAFLASHLECLLSGNNSHLTPVFVDQAHLRDTYPLINAVLVFAGRKLAAEARAE